MSVGRRKLVSSAAIIACCTVACASLSCVLSWGRRVLSEEPAGRLPAPPGDAERILAIETERFFEAVPVVSTSNGEVYRYARSTGEHAWQAGNEPVPTQDNPCTEAHRQALAEAAGSLAECREVQPPGEWCPAPIFAYAVGPDGSVWELADEQACPLATAAAFVILGVVGSVVGVCIAVVRLLMLRWRRA